MPGDEQNEFKIEHDCIEPDWILWGENQPIVTCRDCGDDFYAPIVLDDGELEALKLKYEY